MTRGVPRPHAAGYGWLRLLPVLAAIGYVGLLHTPEIEPSIWDWGIALASGSLVVAGGRYPLTVTAVQSGMLALAVAVAPMAPGMVQILAGVALAELAFRRSGLPVYVGTTLLLAASAWNHFPGYTLAANVMITVLEVALPLLLGSYLRSARELARAAEQRAVDAELSREREATAARATERAAVARELHDVVAHHVAAIVLRVGVVRHVVPSADARITEALEDVHAIGGQALDDLRGLVTALRDPGSVGAHGLLTGSDLSAALDMVVARTRQAGVEVAAKVEPGAVEGLGTAHRHAVLRLVQEGLTNVLKHAGPGASATVDIGREPGSLRVAISDGGGATVPAAGSGGHGLLVMRERVELLDGSLRAGPSGSGWALRADLPQETAVAEPAW
ncbi:hypothetical protein CFN78_14570 [Amycolatopsis antarctica]|uniref:histidine kinase n=1 Tax=Amycolatopsis antarctica TaxID=1854586 RepID=A0A263D460_9PSEU|nr:histidine kinase [Amycolatopsis antarctica]OZM72246.1 hypothetical protein CFN78_14570 [Amycolatopsis antarctica]